MTSADAIAGIDLAAWDPIEGEVEDGGKNFVSLPPEGKYFGTAPIITDEAFGRTQQNYPNVNIDPITILGPDGKEGYKVRFTRLSSKKYSNRNSSQVIDYLRACGISQVPTSEDSMKQLVKATSGKTFQFVLQWEAYDKATQESIKGEESFPIVDGQRQTWVPSSVDPDVKVYANGRVKFFISAVGK